MLFEVGETVVYPHHGAATIIEVKERVIKGETKKYLKLNVTQGDLVIEVPADNVDLVGVRDVIGKERAAVGNHGEPGDPPHAAGRHRGCLRRRPDVLDADG